MEARLRWIRRSGRARWLGAAGLVLVAALYVRLGPVPATLLDVSDARPSVQVYDRHGERLYEARSERGTRGAWLPPDRLPPIVVAATLAAEDHRFWSHPGVDPIAITRAFWRNLREWRVAEGGSTISQQVVSLAEARAGRPLGRGWFGKLREATLALRLEHRLAKPEILARYLAFAPYGNQVEGIARASTYYFGVPADDLTPAQAAYLAALPQRPGRFNPRRDTALAQPRQHRILHRMYEEGWLGADALQVALAERIRISAEEPESIAPHWVQRTLASQTGPGDVGAIRTTLDAPLQRTVLGILRAQRPALDRHHARQVAVVVLDNHTQEWRVWVTDGSDIDAAMTPRQPGSALKPFTYAAAFERGWHPGRVLADVPSTFPTAEPGILYSPRNYDGRFRGPLRARLALAGSENVPAVALAADIGVPAVVDLLRRAGISTLSQTAAHYGLGITLGNAEVRLDELVRAYSLFAGEGAGKKTSGVFFEDIRDEKDTRRLFSGRTTYWITDILADPEARRYIFGEGSSLDFPFVVAAKTDPGAKAAGISMFVMDRSTHGLSATKLDKLGWRASDTGEIAFDDVRIPATALMGQEGHGFYYIMQKFALERIGMAVGAIAASEHALGQTVAYMHEREAFGRSISKFQVLRHRIAQLTSEVEMQKQFIYHICHRHAKGEYVVKEAAMAKLLATQLSDKVATECLQMFGGYGFMEDYPLARFYRDTRLGQIGGGTSEIMCEIIAKMVIDDVRYA